MGLFADPPARPRINIGEYFHVRRGIPISRQDEATLRGMWWGLHCEESEWGTRVAVWLEERFRERQQAERDEADRRAKADAWDECLDTIERNELNTAEAREGNPYRKAAGE